MRSSHPVLFTPKQLSIHEPATQKVTALQLYDKSYSQVLNTRGGGGVLIAGGEGQKFFRKIIKVCGRGRAVNKRGGGRKFILQY